MSTEKKSLRLLPSSYWSTVSGAGDKDAEKEKSKIECNASVKTDTNGLIKGSMACEDQTGLKYGASGEYNPRTGYASAELNLWFER